MKMQGTKQMRRLAAAQSAIRHARAPHRVLEWSRNAWRFANYMLADGVTDVGVRVSFIVSALTQMIRSGTIGCADCSKHWNTNLQKYQPIGLNTLQKAREWLVNIHNASNPTGEQQTLQKVAADFGWTLEPPPQQAL